MPAVRSAVRKAARPVKRSPFGLSVKTITSWGVQDPTVHAWLQAAHQGTGAVELLAWTDSNGFFDGDGIEWGLNQGAKLQGFEHWGSPLRRLDTPGSTGWTPFCVSSASDFAGTGAPSALTDLYPGWGADTYRQFGYDYMAAAGGSMNVYHGAVSDLYWPDGEALKQRVHYGQWPDGGAFKLFVQEDLTPFDEIDSGNRITVDASGAASLQIAERDVAEGAVEDGTQLRWTIMRGADRPTAEQFIIGQRLARSGMTYGLAYSMLWAGGGQSSLDVANSLDGAPSGGLQAVLERIKADHVAQGISSPKLLMVWCHGINDRTETTTSKDTVNASNTKAGYKANVAYCMDAIDAAASAAGVTIGWLLIGPHVRPTNDYVSDDVADDEELHQDFRAALKELSLARPRVQQVDLATQVTGETKDGNSEYDNGGTAHQNGPDDAADGYLADGQRLWSAMGFANQAPSVTPTVATNDSGSAVTVTVATTKWAALSGQVRAAASAAPSVADVKAGTGALGSGEANDTARPWDSGSLTVTGLSGETDYIFYVVGTDENGADSVVASVAFTTPESTYVPSDHANHYLSWDPADIVTSGSAITSWPTAYGSATLTADAGEEPTEVDVSGETLSQGDGTELLATTGLSLPPPWTIVARVRIDAGTAAWSRVISLSAGATADSGHIIPFLQDASSGDFGVWLASAVRGKVTPSVGTIYTVTITCDASGNVSCQLDDATASTGSGAADTTTLTRLGLHGRPDTASVSDGSDSTIGAMSIYKAILSGGDLDNAKAWVENPV